MPILGVAFAAHEVPPFIVAFAKVVLAKFGPHSGTASEVEVAAPVMEALVMKNAAMSGVAIAIMIVPGGQAHLQDAARRQLAITFIEPLLHIEPQVLKNIEGAQLAKRCVGQRPGRSEERRVGK